MGLYRLFFNNLRKLIMKLKFLTFGITALCFPAWAQTDKIVEHELSESKVFEVHTGKGVTTTLLFPAQIAVVGGSLVTDPQKEQGLMSFTPGPSHFTISGLRDKGSTNVNVFCQGKAYSIILSVSDSPVYKACLLYTSPSPRDQRGSRMPSSA